MIDDESIPTPSATKTSAALGRPEVVRHFDTIHDALPGVAFLPIVTSKAVNDPAALRPFPGGSRATSRDCHGTESFTAGRRARPGRADVGHGRQGADGHDSRSSGPVRRRIGRRVQALSPPEQRLDVRDRYRSDYAASQEVTTVLRQGSAIERHMRQQGAGMKGASEWDATAADLKRLVEAFSTTFRFRKVPRPDGSAIRRSWRTWRTRSPRMPRN